MKDVAINFAATLPATLKMWQDGDIHRESQTDILLDSYADAIGYTITLVGTKVSISANNTFTGDTIFNPTSNAHTQFNSGVAFLDDLSADATRAGLYQRQRLLTDASTNEITNSDIYLVPTITANRTYRFGAVDVAGRIITVRRMRTADAFTVTIRDNAATDVGVIPASQAGFITMVFDPLATPYWRPIAWSANITSLATT